MRRRTSVVIASVIAAPAMVVASLVPGAGHVVQARQAAHPAAAFTLKAPPKVTNAAAAKKYKGQSIIFYGDTVGIGNQVDKAMATEFTKETGIKVTVIGKPDKSDQAYSTYSRLFTSHSDRLDVAMIDTIWPAAFAPYLVDLKPALGSQTSHFYSTLIQNDTIGGHLVGMPEFGDLGMLYYRTDLLKKYHISSPPTTWQQLAADAKKIQAGEQKKDKNFYGFVFQGNTYEGLTCDALEWLASSGGGTIIENGKVTINNPKAVAMLNMVRGWVGTISPRDVTTYTETESNNQFDNGEAAFLRNWPYAYAVGEASPKIKGKIAVVPLPHAPGAKSVGTVGGWQLAISKYSKHIPAAEEFVRYVTQPSTSVWLSVVGSFVPTQPAVASNPAVKKAMPFLGPLQKTIRVTRPAKFLGARYNEASSDIWEGVNQILTGSDASSVLPSTQRKLERLIS